MAEIRLGQGMVRPGAWSIGGVLVRELSAPEPMLALPQTVTVVPYSCTANWVPAFSLDMMIESDTVDEGDVGAVHLTTKRAFHVNLFDDTGGLLTADGGTQYDEDARL